MTLQRDDVHIAPPHVSSAGSVFSQSRVSKPSGNVKANPGMPRPRGSAQYQYTKEFKRGRIVGIREAGLSYRDVSVRTGNFAMALKHVWKQCIEEGHTQRRAGTLPRNVTTTWDMSHVIRIAVTNCTASSMALNRRWGTATSVELSASRISRCLLRAGLVARMLLCRLTLSINHRRLRQQ